MKLRSKMMLLAVGMLVGLLCSTGLGLYLTRELCEANQARVTYTRDQRGGSCFRITFAHPDRITA